MNVKRLALIGVLALVVIGCVVAAGCTSQVNTDPDQVNPASGTMTYSDNPIVGTWITDDGLISLVFSSDHRWEFKYNIIPERAATVQQGDWEMDSDFFNDEFANFYTLNCDDGNCTTAIIDPVKGQLKCNVIIAGTYYKQG